LKLRADARKRKSISCAAMWRKVAGVEPTEERLTPPTGFEAQPHHRMRMPSEFANPQATLVAQAY